MHSSGNDMKATTAITLLVPGLFPPQSDAAQAAQDFVATVDVQRFGATAEFVPHGPQGLEQSLFEAFGVETAEDKDLPVAAVTRALDFGEMDDGWWLRADPVCLQPNRGELVLVEGRHLDLHVNDARQLVQAIQGTIEPGRIEAPHPHRWYLSPASIPRIQTFALSQVVDQNVDRYLPYGEDALLWHRWLNQVQMVLHDSAVNLNREERDELPVNSVWLWGGGVVPSISASRWAQVWSDESVGAGLARLSGTPVAALPATGGEWLQQAHRPGAHLIVLETPAQSPTAGAPNGQSLDESVISLWVRPLIAALRSAAVDYLEVWDPHHGCLRADAKAMKSWWRRARSRHVRPRVH